jgi:threonine aldolase
MKTIDLRSDTITQPTDEMIEAIVSAHKSGRYGDDVIGDDEVVIELQEKAAKILGKKAALLVSSGTQGNLISLLAQTKRGDEVVVEEHTHMYVFEAGAMASLGGLYPKPVAGQRGYILPETLESVISPDDVHYAKTSFVAIENTHTFSGGAIIRPDQVKALASMAHDHGLKIHCDGARLFHASVAMERPVTDFIDDIDSVQICLSKGLSAPVGSMVAGTEEFIHEARRLRKKLGGGMRQASIIAAPAIVALETMIDRLKDDHDNAKTLYKRIVDIPDLIIEEPETNILYLDLRNLSIDAPGLAEALAKKNILVFGAYGDRTRMVLNRMVDREDLDRVVAALEHLLK